MGWQGDATNSGQAVCSATVSTVDEQGTASNQGLCRVIRGNVPPRSEPQCMQEIIGNCTSCVQAEESIAHHLQACHQRKWLLGC